MGVLAALRELAKKLPVISEGFASEFMDAFDELLHRIKKETGMSFVSGQVFVFGAGFLGEFDFEFVEGGRKLGITGSEDLDGEKAGVAGRADADGGDGHAGRHLDDGKERVEAFEGFAFNRHADDGQGGECRADTGQMGCAACAGNDDFEAVFGRGADVGFEAVRVAMGGNDFGFAGDTEFSEGVSGQFHGGPVGIAAH